MPLSLPVETIEHTIGYLDDDTRSLATCSLICRDLLPVCRNHIWRDISLPIGPYPGATPPPRTAAFLEIIGASPVVAFHVHSLSLSFQDGSVKTRDPILWSKSDVYGVVARLPSLKTLRVYNMLGIGRSLYELIAIARDFPLLQALHLQNIHIEDQDWGERVDLRSLTASSTNPARWALKKLAIIGGFVPASLLSQLVSFLEQSADRVSLQSLDLRSPILSSDSALQDWPDIPSFASSLQHLGVALNDVSRVGEPSIVERERMQRVLAALPLCRSLRSLCLQYDLFEYSFQIIYTHPDSLTPPAPRFISSLSFLDLLSDVLSAPGEAPLPCLERLSLVFLSPPHWLVNFRASFHKLAEALVGDLDNARSDGAGIRRFPRFSRLNLHTAIIQDAEPLWGERQTQEYLAKAEVVKRDLILPMLAPFARAGVGVQVILE
ncbi:hypothetical protein BV20DRAFT_774252 [Pilatotrama ljubarskyi]|nr:hypothetical protein BV20DRAFT_774252 [Pilatotrama ljubarskyi]